LFFWVEDDGEPFQVKIRLAYVVHGFEFGGLERCVANLVNHLDPVNFEPHIISLTCLGNAKEWVEAKNVNFVQLEKCTGNDLGVYRRLSNYLKAERIRLVHSHNWGTLLEVAVACGWRKIPFVHAEHGLDFRKSSTGIKGAIRRRLMRWGMRRAACLVPIAQCVQRKMIEVVGTKGFRFDLIPNGIELPEGLGDVAFRNETRSRLGIAPDATIFGSVGRLGDVKGFDQAIKAMSWISSRSENCHMLLVGDGPVRQKLEALVLELGLTGRVHLVGAQKRVGAWLGVMDIFFNSSRSEAMNLAILEAMAAGIPIVAMDVGDNRILVEVQQRVGTVVPEGDVQQFAEKLIDLATDRELCVRFGHKGREAYERNYTLRKMSNSYTDLYLRTLAALG
jgi:glycosyltransferase involved in cell wall biosynthesis